MLETVSNIIEDSGLEDLDQLQELSEKDLKTFGLKQFHILKLQKGFQKRRNPAEQAISGSIAPVDFDIDKSTFNMEKSEYIDASMIEPISTATLDQSYFPKIGSSYSYIMYETYQDSSTESMMTKIKLNDDTFHRFIQDVSCFKEVNVIGLYGSFEDCLTVANSFLKVIIEISSEVKSLDDGIILLRNNDNVALIYKTKECGYDFLKPKEKSPHASTYIRYLIDVCQHVYAVVDEKFTMNPDNISPFLQKLNPSLTMSQVAITESEIEDAKRAQEQLEVLVVPFAKGQYVYESQKLQCFPDQSKFLPEAFINQGMQDSYMDQKQSKRINEMLLYDGRLEGVKEFRMHYYEDVKQHISCNWYTHSYYFYEPNYPNKFSLAIEECVMPFIPIEFQEELWNFVKQLEHECQQQYHTIIEQYKQLNRELNQSIIGEIVTQFQVAFCPKTVSQVQKRICDSKKKFDASVYEQCQFECQRLKIFERISQQIDLEQYQIKILEQILSSKHLRNLQVQLHYSKLMTFKSQIGLYCGQLLNDMHNLKLQKDQAHNQLRMDILSKLFNVTDNMMSQLSFNHNVECKIRFNQIHLIQESAYKSQYHWNESKVHMQLHYSFKKQKSANLKLKKLLFVSDKMGFAIFENSPSDKQVSIYSFNFQKKNEKKTFLNFRQHLLNHDSEFVCDNWSKRFFTYSNLKMTFHLGNFAKEALTESSTCHIYDNSKQLVKEIKSACFLPKKDRILILNESSTLIEYYICSHQLSVVQKSLEIDGETQVFQLRPDDPQDYFQEIQTTFDGIYVILRTTKALQIYDLNWDIIYSYEIKGRFHSFKTIEEGHQSFLLIQTSELKEVLYLKRTDQRAVIKTEVTGKNKKNKHRGNPVFDLVYDAFQKYGPHSDFIGAPQFTNLHFVTVDSILSDKIIQSYTSQLKLQKQNVTVAVLQQQTCTLKPPQSEQVSTKSLEIILLSRIAMHVATIENFTLVPLKDGVNISDQIIERLLITRDDQDDDCSQKTALIERIIEMIKFGIYEETLLNTIKGGISVVSIVGKQSGGKSYVMNRFFGTRFDVSAGRCTDGIWMSISQITLENGMTKTFVVLDCEGLFSERRNDQEEMKLCLVLSAISDIMILNQDLSFNRYLNKLFNSFTNSVGKIKGKQLFKGAFMMLIRDLKAEQSSQAFNQVKETFSKIMQKPKNFIEAIFGNKLLTHGLNYFEMPTFDDEINVKREEIFMSMGPERWRSGKDFLDSFKITLAQVFADDDTDIDQHKLKILCDNLFSVSQDVFHKGGLEFFTSDKSVVAYDVVINGQSYSINTQQGEISLEKFRYQYDDENEDHKLSLRQDFLLFSQLTVPYSQKIHNEWVTSFSMFLNVILDSRQKFILNNFQQKTIENSEPQSDITKPYLYKLQNFFESYNRQAKLCPKNCRVCMRYCVLSQNHKKNCNCQTKHLCYMPCTVNPNCAAQNFLCVEIYGHEGEHRCSEGNHRCSEECSVQNCNYLCSLEINHNEEEVDHDCGNRHPCPEKCDDENCFRSCQLDITPEHDLHHCGDTQCGHKCNLCDRRCIFPFHMHEKLIKEGQTSELTKCLDGDLVRQYNYHICDQEHPCKQQCNQEGICAIDFKIIEKVWRNEFGEFTYPYFKPVDTTLHCRVMILKYLKDHTHTSLSHNCRVENHRCGNQCPECKSFCGFTVNHAGTHWTSNHRNKEQSVFVQSSIGEESKTIQFISDGKKREYKIGESCQPENCTTSCARKGRSHFHLKECKGQMLCYANSQTVRHSKEKYYPFEDKTFDQWLCNNYWKSLNWSPPVDANLAKEIQSCNFVCCHRSHAIDENDSKKVFCKSNAWHTGGHTFSCGHQSKGDFKYLDIVFCVDVTGSMGRYLASTTRTILEVVKQIQVSSKLQKNILFGFVGYRDHQDEYKSFLVRHKDLSEGQKIVDFINYEMSARGGGGDGAEAVMDGLYASLNSISWRADSAKYIFHVCDSPGHGSQYGPKKHDAYPDGCPCGVTLEYVSKELSKKKISYKLVKIGSFVNKMADIFKAEIADYEQFEISDALELVDRVSEVIVRDIQSQELDVLVPQ